MVSSEANVGSLLLQIKCRGRGEVPDPEVVNQFCYEVHKFKAEERQSGLPPRHILVHCTHGYNRSGRLLSLFLILYVGTSSRALGPT